MTPAQQTKLILLEASRLGARLFRANVGLAWAGSRITKHADGSITIHDPRPFKAGVTGQSDTSGWVTREITADMAGQRIAQFVAVECKMGTGRLTKEQAAYLQAVQEAGGRAGVARSPDDVRAILGGL